MYHEIFNVAAESRVLFLNTNQGSIF